VRRWWNDEFTPEAIERDFGPAIDGTEPAECWLVEVDGESLGLIQYSRFADYPDYVEQMAPVYPVPVGAVSIDYLIGEPTAVGKGLGTAMIARFVDHVWSTDATASSIVVPVNTANVASWRTLMAVGFRLVARGELEPDNPIDGRSHEVLRLDRP
jgi:aminoglycoside 6'-N-acetyltransferase